MLATKCLFLGLGLLCALVSASPVPIDDSVQLVARTRTAAKKQQTEFKKIKKQLDQKLSPPRNKAVFWSGNVGSESTKHHAEKYAKKTGKQTLEMAVKKNGIKMPAFNKPNGGLWKYASNLWAERSKGKTTAILGNMRPKNTYNRIERPALDKNKKVTKHTEHHIAATRKVGPKLKSSSKKVKPQPQKAARKNHNKPAKKHPAPKRVAKTTSNPKKSPGTKSNKGHANAKGSKKRK